MGKYDAVFREMVKGIKAQKELVKSMPATPKPDYLDERIKSFLADQTERKGQFIHSGSVDTPTAEIKKEFNRKCDDIYTVSKILNVHPRELRLWNR